MTDVVQGAPEIVDGIPGNGAEVVGNGLSVSQIPDSLARLRVVLGFDWVSVGDEVNPSLLKIKDVMFGPFNL
jgi:hypothetical protein